MSTPLTAARVLGGLAALFATASFADERSVRIPAYRPAIGQELAYRLSVEAQVDAHGAVEGAGGALKGDMIDRLAVISASAEGYKMRWRLEPCRNAPSAICDLYREKLESYGFDGVVVETNRNGAIQKIEQFDDIKRNVDARLAGLTNPRDPLRPKLTALQAELAADPLAPAATIAAPARLFADAQLDRAQDFELDVPQIKDDVAQIGGKQVPVKTTSVLTADLGRRTATFTQTKTFDAAAYAAAQQGVIQESLAHLQERYPDVSERQLAQFSTAALTVTTKIKLSLDDGTTLFAEETVDNRIGPLSLKNVLRATRE